MTAASRAWALAGALCGLVFAADQAAKAAVEANLVLGEKVAVLGPLELTLTHNRGIAFGLAGGGGVALILLAAVALAVIAYLFAANATKPGMWIAIGLLTGGALGNLVDRVRADAVTDYIDVASWPAFNLADVAISGGVVLLLLLYLRDAEPKADDG
ncbi:MAG TPA: signal peptidase II [Solirubrobacterales bacterium]|nr:signal peptidase II [Solirubrobacterales bacterium]